MFISSCERKERSWWDGKRRREVKQDLVMGYLEGQRGEGVGNTVGKEQEKETMNIT